MNANAMNEVFYRIVGNELDENDLDEDELDDPELIDDLDNVPKITTNGDTVTFITRTAHLRIDMPDAFEINTVLHIADRLECNYPANLVRKLHASQLLTDEVRDRWMGILGALMMIDMPVLIRFGCSAVRLIHTQNSCHTLRLIHADGQTREVCVGDNGRVIRLAEPGTDECAICLETRAETLGQMWATADGCSLHCFHVRCIGRLTQRKCPMCRAQLE
jgi:hypothetical protein